MRDTVHDDFDRDRDLLFDLFRRNSGPLRDDLNIVVGYIGVRLNRQVTKSGNTPREEQQCEGYDENAVIESKINDQANHFLLLPRGALRALRAVLQESRRLCNFPTPARLARASIWSLCILNLWISGHTQTVRWRVFRFWRNVQSPNRSIGWREPVGVELNFTRKYESVDWRIPNLSDNRLIGLGSLPS